MIVFSPINQLIRFFICKSWIYCKRSREIGSNLLNRYMHTIQSKRREYNITVTSFSVTLCIWTEFFFLCMDYYINICGKNSFYFCEVLYLFLIEHCKSLFFLISKNLSKNKQNFCNRQGNEIIKYNNRKERKRERGREEKLEE